MPVGCNATMLTTVHNTFAHEKVEVEVSDRATLAFSLPVLEWHSFDDACSTACTSPLCSVRAIEAPSSKCSSTPPFGSPPSTTCSTPRVRQEVTELPGAPRDTAPPRLLAALRRHSLEEARAALEEDPSAAGTPFVDHGWEPPLCAAVRLGCAAAILALLVERGADASDTDCYKRTPLAILDDNSILREGWGYAPWMFGVEAGLYEERVAAWEAARQVLLHSLAARQAGVPMS